MEVPLYIHWMPHIIKTIFLHHWSKVPLQNALLLCSAMSNMSNLTWSSSLFPTTNLSAVFQVSWSAISYVASSMIRYYYVCIPDEPGEDTNAGTCLYITFICSLIITILPAILWIAAFAYTGVQSGWLLAKFNYSGTSDSPFPYSGSSFLTSEKRTTSQKKDRMAVPKCPYSRRLHCICTHMHTTLSYRHVWWRMAVHKECSLHLILLLLHCCINIAIGWDSHHYN